MIGEHLQQGQQWWWASVQPQFQVTEKYVPPTGFHIHLTAQLRTPVLDVRSLQLELTAHSAYHRKSTESTTIFFSSREDQFLACFLWSHAARTAHCFPVTSSMYSGLTKKRSSIFSCPTDCINFSLDTTGTKATGN